MQHRIHHRIVLLRDRSTTQTQLNISMSDIQNDFVQDLMIQWVSIAEQYHNDKAVITLNELL